MANLYLDADVKDELAAVLEHLGNDVLTAYEVGRRRAGDEEQLSYAAALGRILVTHNSDDYLLLQRAWRHWAAEWSVEPRPVHAGILAAPQPPRQSVEVIAREIDAVARSRLTLTNRFYKWRPSQGWVQDG